MEGKPIQSCSRLTASSCRLATSARMSARSSAKAVEERRARARKVRMIMARILQSGADPLDHWSARHPFFLQPFAKDGLEEHLVHVKICGPQPAKHVRNGPDILGRHGCDLDPCRSARKPIAYRGRGSGIFELGRDSSG